MVRWTTFWPSPPLYLGLLNNLKPSHKEGGPYRDHKFATSRLLIFTVFDKENLSILYLWSMNRVWYSSLLVHKYVFWQPRDVIPANIYMFKVNDRNARKRFEICSRLTIKTEKRRQWHRSSVFVVNFEHISY